MTTQWSIAQLERTTATDGDYSASSYGTCSFTPDADLSAEDADVVVIASAVFTDEAKAAYAASLAG
jgi:hypothetical protein